MSSYRLLRPGGCDVGPALVPNLAKSSASCAASRPSHWPPAGETEQHHLRRLVEDVDPVQCGGWVGCVSDAAVIAPQDGVGAVSHRPRCGGAELVRAREEVGHEGGAPGREDLGFGVGHPQQTVEFGGICAALEMADGCEVGRVGMQNRAARGPLLAQDRVDFEVAREFGGRVEVTGVEDQRVPADAITTARDLDETDFVFRRVAEVAES